jgi:hypothetical protein
MRGLKTPFAPKILIICPGEGDPLKSPENKKQLRMGNGMVLCLGKHSCPDILIQIVNYLTQQMLTLRVTSRHYCAKYNMGLTLNIIAYSTSSISTMMAYIWQEYLTLNMLDPDTQISVYGYVLYFCSAPIHETLRLERVSKFHPLIQNIMQRQRLLRKSYLQRSY